MVRLFHLHKKGNQVLSIGKELLSCFSHAKKRDFHENPDHIYTELTFINPLSVYYKKRMPLSSAEIFEDPSIYSVDPDQTASIGSVWSGSTLYASIIMLTNKQTFSDALILLVFKGLIHMICFFAEVFWRKLILTFE